MGWATSCGSAGSTTTATVSPTFAESRLHSRWAETLSAHLRVSITADDHHAQQGVHGVGQ